MNKHSCLLIFALAANFAQAQNQAISGVVDSVSTVSGKKQVQFRAGLTDLTLDYKKLSSADQAAVDAPVAKTKIISVQPSPGAVISQRNVPNGVRADCSELPVKIGDLETIANSSTDMMDFLKKIPTGSLQGFTFVTNSLSLHRGSGDGKVSPTWPRVLRSSTDGKMTVSFVCDPRNPTFGRVEIFHFDENTKEFKTTEFDFGHPNGRSVPSNDRVRQNPQSCVSCHAGGTFNGKVSLKPNWPEYFAWSDCEADRKINFYGGNDDNMGPTAHRARLPTTEGKAPAGCAGAKDVQAHNQEKQDYQKFRQTQKNNDCFNTLPWPDASKRGGVPSNQPDLAFYPYSDVSAARAADGLQNYSVRTNARFTDVYSHLMSQRIDNLMQKHPDYELVKYFLALEEANCFTPDDEAKLKKALPKMAIDRTVKVKANLVGYSPEETHPILYNFGNHIGMAPKDWTMEFREEKDPVYNTTMFKGLRTEGFGDAQIPNVVAGEVLKDISKTNPQVARVSANALTRGISEAFGNRFSCIDDLGGSVRTSAKGANGPLCRTLHAENDKHLAKLATEGRNGADCPECAARKAAETQAAQLRDGLKDAAKKLDQASVARGKELIKPENKGKCIMCHSASVDMLPRDFRFMPSDSDLKKAESIAILKARAQEGDLLQRFENRLIKAKSMPPMETGLTDADRNDIKAYLTSIAAQPK